jgi:hypothetical protein
MNRKEREMIYGLLIHLGRNMWAPHTAADHVRCDEKVWTEITEHMADVGANMLVIDIGEAMIYPSHPELAVKGSWSPDRMRSELKRLRSLGIEPIPKLNFSSSHHAWLKGYGRMMCTREYYQVVADVIRDTSEIFDRPRFFHLGWDEEKEKIQKVNRFDYMAIRQGDLWWHDMLYTVKQAEMNGSRGWIWSDYQWLHKEEFFEKCPRSVMQSHWFYSAGFEPGKEIRDDKKMREAKWAEPHTLCVFKELDEAGYDQICCGSNIYNHNNFPDMVKHCLRNVSEKRLFGFLNAPWGEVDASAKNRGRYLNAVDQLAGARGMVERFRRLRQA